MSGGGFHHHGKASLQLRRGGEWRSLKHFSLFFLQELMRWKFWLAGVFSSVLCVFGFVGNLFAAVVLWGPKMSSAFNQLLIALCAFDTLFLVCNAPFCLSTLGVETRECSRRSRDFKSTRKLFVDPELYQSTSTSTPILHCLTSTLATCKREAVTSPPQSSGY